MNEKEKDPPTDMERLMRGEKVFSNGHVYAMCSRCKKIIKLTGWFGDLHFCV